MLAQVCVRVSLVYLASLMLLCNVTHVQLKPSLCHLTCARGAFYCYRNNRERMASAKISDFQLQLTPKVGLTFDISKVGTVVVSTYTKVCLA